MGGTGTQDHPRMCGKSVSWYVMTSSTWDHLRVCGEKAGAAGCRSCREGSPPRMRGKASRTRFNRDQTRITPAYAGKRSGIISFSSLARDHPRVCGEKQDAAHTLLAVLGSPPRMRGKAKREKTISQIVRITPAYAGKRTILRIFSRAARDHPRVCGEKAQKAMSSTPKSGSPPRMRGKDLLF